MALVNQDRQLERALNDAFQQAKRRCLASIEPAGGVVITFVGHVRGVWKGAPGGMTFTPPGYAEPTYTAQGIAAAVQYSMDVVCKG